jgi:hypothetical protein
VGRLGWPDVRLLHYYRPGTRPLHYLWLGENLIPAYSQRFLLLDAYAPGWLPPGLKRFGLQWQLLDGGGWLALPGLEPKGDPVHRQKWREKTLAECRPLLHAFHPHDSSDRALRDLLADCRREGIAVALLLLSDYVQRRYSPEALTAIDRYSAGLSAAWGAPVIDLRDCVADEGFVDGIHLDYAAAAVISERFGRELLSPLLGAKTDLDVPAEEAAQP